MKISITSLQYFVGALLLIFSSCTPEVVDQEEITYPESFTVHAVRIDHLGEVNPRTEELWDEDGSGPDLFIRYTDENNLVLYSDTVFDYDFTPELIIELPVPQIIHRDSTDTGFSFQIRDMDILPSLPASVQSNDLVSRGGAPLYLPHFRFHQCNQDFYRIRNQGYITLSLGVACN